MVTAKRITAQRTHNIIHTLVILFSMLTLFGILGWTTFGISGLEWALIFGVILLLSSPRVSPAVVLKLYQARQLGYHEAEGFYKIISELSRRAKLSPEPKLYYIPSK